MKQHNKAIWITLIAVLSVFSIACSAAADITAIPKGAFIVDVRTPDEYNAGHFPGATNIPLDTVKDRLSEFGDKNRTIVVYCRSGRRSGLAQQILKDAGYTDVQNGGGLSHMMAMKK